MITPILCRWCNQPGTEADRLVLTVDGFPEHEGCEAPEEVKEAPEVTTALALQIMIGLSAEDRNSKPQTVLEFPFGRYRVHIYRMDGGYDGDKRRIRVDFNELVTPGSSE